MDFKIRKEIEQCLESLILKITCNEKLCNCKLYYRSKLFDDLCSKCCFEKNPTNKNLPKKTEENLFRDKLIKKYTVPKSHFIWSSIKRLFETGSVRKVCNFFSLIDFMEKNTIYKGITAEQAEELIKISENSHYNWISKVKKWRVGHSICGLIYDIWNIDKYKISSVQCYYELGNERIDEKFTCILMNDKCRNLDCKNNGKSIVNCEMYHNSRFYMCYKNMVTL